MSTILGKVRAMTTLDRDDYVRANYLGKQVHWYARAFGLFVNNITGDYDLSFAQRGPHSNARGLIFVHVRPGTFPEIERLQRATKVDLWGTISDVDSYLGVTLQLERAEVFPRTLFDKTLGFFEHTGR